MEVSLIFHQTHKMYIENGVNANPVLYILYKGRGHWI